MTLYYGRCRGGPYNSRMLAGFEPIERVAFDRYDPMRTYPGQQVSTFERDCLFGSYVFMDALGEWIWDQKSVSETRETDLPVHKSETENMTLL